MKNRKLAIGTKLHNRYVIREVIGSGGFGIIYEAFDELLNSMVAVKEFFVEECMTRDSSISNQIALSEKDADMEKIARCHAMFLREIKIMEVLKNVPYTPRIKESFSENGTEYIVMKRIRGESLQELVKRKGPMKAKVLFPMLRTVMIALMEMQKLHIIHRDISPGNMMLAEDGDLYLIDFGGAILIEKNSSLWNSQVVEHIGFQAPEYNQIQLQGLGTDVYSMCATIVYLLTGNGIPSPEQRAVYDDIPQRLMRLSISRSQQETLRKGLQMNVQQRYETMKQCYDDLYGDMKNCYRPEKVRYCACTQIGDRKINQDNFMVDGQFYFEGRDLQREGVINCQANQIHIVAVCDGVGGANSGELASRAVVQALDHFVAYYRDSEELPEHLLEEQLDQINEKIITLGKKIGPTASTLSLLLWKENQYYIANIGDSPIYRKRGFELEQLHTPHTLARAKYLEGQVAVAKDKHTLMNYLGKQQVSGSQMASFRHGYIQKGDRFLLCSDGVTNKIDLDRVSMILRKSERKAVDSIFRMLKRKIGKDNCTAIIISF